MADWSLIWSNCSTNLSPPTITAVSCGHSVRCTWPPSHHGCTLCLYQPTLGKSVVIFQCSWRWLLQTCIVKSYPIQVRIQCSILKLFNTRTLQYLIAANITSLVRRRDGGEVSAAEGERFSIMLKGKVSRKVVKQTVMTAVYGITVCRRVRPD
jgi:hypothetical protein